MKICFAGRATPVGMKWSLYRTRSALLISSRFAVILHVFTGHFELKKMSRPVWIVRKLISEKMTLKYTDKSKYLVSHSTVPDH